MKCDGVLFCLLFWRASTFGLQPRPHLVHEHMLAFPLLYTIQQCITLSASLMMLESNYSETWFRAVDNNMRRILRGRGSGRRPGTPARPSASPSRGLQQSTQSSLANTNTNTTNNAQQQPGGFSFGQQAGGTTQGSNQTNISGILQSSQLPGSVGSTALPSFNPSATGFNFSVGQGTAVNNPFANNNMQNSPGQSGGYQGSMFNIPPPTSNETPREVPKDASKDPWNETQEFDTRVRAKSVIETLDRLTNPEKEAYRQESIKPPQFASHAPFKWPEGEQVVKDDPHISWNWTTQSLESTQQLPTANPTTNLFGQSTIQQQQSPNNLFGQNATSTQAQPTSILFGQQNPHQGQSTSKLFGNTATPVNPPQSAQHTSDIFGNLNSQRTQQPAGNLFGQNATQQQQQQTSNMFGQSATQPQQPTYSMFGQNATQHQQATYFQQSTSSAFGQNATQFEQLTGNIFGPNSTQPQQSNAFVTQTEDSMSTSPDNPSHKSPDPQPGPFAFLNSSPAPGQNDNASIRGQGGSLFDRITKPPGTSTNITGEGQNSSLMPTPNKFEITQGQGGGLFERLSKTSSTLSHSSGDGQGLTQNNTNPISASDPFEMLKAKPVYSGSSTSPIKSPPRPRPGPTLFTGSNPQIAPPIISMPASQDGKPATSNFFGGIKLPPASQPVSTFSPLPSKALTSANAQNREGNGSGVNERGTSSSTTAVTESSGDKDLSLFTGDRTIGMPPPAPADFTADQKRELVTGYRLKALEMGLQKRIMKSTTFHTDSETVFRFYEERKQAIIDAGGLPLKQIAGNKRISPNETKLEGAPGKRAKLEAPLSQTLKPQARVANDSPFNRDALSDTGNRQALGSKRKADDDSEKNTEQGAMDSAKRARGDEQISYPSLPISSLNSQTSSIFKNILGSKETLATDGSKSTVNVSNNANASDPKAPSVTMGKSLQFKPSSTSNNSSLFATSSFPSKAAATASMLPASKPATESPPKKAFPSMAQPASSTNANPFSTKSGSTEPSSTAPFASMTPSSPSTVTNPFSIKSNTTKDNPSAVVKPPTFGTGAPSNFLSQFGKTAEETAKKEKEKRKAEDFDSDEDDEAEWERKDAEEQRAKKQKLEEALKPKKANFIPGKGFVFSDDDTEKQKEKSTQPEGVVPPFFTTQTPTNSSASIFSQQSSTQGIVNSHNIFSHLSDVDSGAEGSKTGDADDEDDGSEGGSDHDEDQYGRAGVKGREQSSAQQNSPKKSEDATPFSNGNPFGAANGHPSQSPKVPTSEAQSSGPSLFARISRDESGDAIREVPPADGDTPENSSKPSLFPTTSGLFNQAPSPFSGSNIFGPSSSSKSPFNILGSSSPSKPTSNIFGQPSSSTPATLATDPGNSPQGDHTWKPDTPIKFGSASDTPGVKVISPMPSKPSFGGLFGSPPANAANETPATPTSNIFSSTPAKSPSVGFGFAFGGPPKTATSTLAPPLGAASATTSRATSPGATTAGESANDSTADGEDDAAGRDEQIDLTSGGPGEEDEDILFEVKAKALSFDSDKKTWASKGIGLFRVLKHRESGKARMLLRQETIGRIVLNAALLSAMKYEYTNNKSVKMAVASDNGKLATWMIRVGKDDDAQKLASVLEENKSN